MLITLGIIGIVAAMTMPSLIQNNRKKEATSRLKKFYSSMSQAILLSENDNGPSYEWNRKANIKDAEGNDDNNSNAIESYSFFSKYLAPYMKTLKIEQGAVVTGDDGTETYFPTKVYLNDGSIILLNNGSCMDLVLDVNGDRKPNENGRDMFTFLLCPTRETSRFGYGNKNFGTYFGTDVSREEAIRRCIDLAYSCSDILQIDDWEFKDDYPYRL